jgi:fructosamine-3-kinase
MPHPLFQKIETALGAAPLEIGALGGGCVAEVYHLRPAAAQKHAAELLSARHSVAAPAYGLERDPLIGGVHQPNPRRGSWLELFREQRLLRPGFMEVRCDLNNLYPLLVHVLLFGGVCVQSVECSLCRCGC